MMTIAVTQIAVVLFLLLGGSGQSSARPDVPQKLAVPENEQLVLRAHASGVQIYNCEAGADQKPSWVLKAPQAELFDARGKTIGHHFAGPAWNNVDGSAVTGKAVAREDAPASDDIPWLLITVTSHSGNGVLSRVTTIQRIHTKGGQPPSAAACDGSHVGAETKSSYTADYYFYAPAH
jgi:hypothetical protein